MLERSTMVETKASLDGPSLKVAFRFERRRWNLRLLDGWVPKNWPTVLERTAVTFLGVMGQ
jgi:hypothetical protein